MMDNIFESAVLISIVIALLFFGYHIAMYLVQQQAASIAARSAGRSHKQLPIVENLPTVNGTIVAPAAVAAQLAPQIAASQQQYNQQNPQPSIATNITPGTPQTVPEQPNASDPYAPTSGSSTFTTELRQPQNLFDSHVFIGGNDQTQPAQNEGMLSGGVGAWDSSAVQAFSAAV